MQRRFFLKFLGVGALAAIAPRVSLPPPPGRPIQNAELVLETSIGELRYAVPVTESGDGSVLAAGGFSVELQSAMFIYAARVELVDSSGMPRVYRVEI